MSPNTYVGIERRQGGRRDTDLPRPVWLQLIGIALAIALGVGAGLALGFEREEPRPSEPIARAPSVDPELLAGLGRLRDEAEALTPAAVDLDERARELWMPRVAEIELALADARTPSAIHAELEATLGALERVGVVRP